MFPEHDAEELESLEKHTMKIKLTTEVEFTPAILHVSAGVRYWQDATVNGKEDEDGTLIPFKVGEFWCPQISLDEGRILNWPQGATAEIHYKVCDCGEYWLEELGGKKAKWKGDYVPDDLLCHGDNGYGDYIILNVNPDGSIKDWEMPELDSEEWELLP